MKVFISFSHIDQENDSRMVALANRLRMDGLDTSIYLLEPHPAEGWIKWMEAQVETADFVLIYASQDYFDKFRQKGQVPSGGRYEGSLISSMIYKKGADFSKVGLICFEKFDLETIPSLLQGCPRYSLRNQSEYETLLRWLTAQPLFNVAPVGLLKHLPSSNVVPLFSVTTITSLTFKDLCESIDPILQENKRIFSNFGPNSSKNNFNRIRTDLTVWNELKKTKVVPNNQSIKSKIEAAKELIPAEFTSVFDRLLLHIEAFKIHVEHGGIDYKENQFPSEINIIVEDVLRAKK